MFSKSEQPTPDLDRPYGTGRYAEVIEPIHGGFPNQRGRVKIDGTHYFAVSYQNLPIPTGTLVVLLARSGNTWTVEPAQIATPPTPPSADIDTLEETAIQFQHHYQFSAATLKKSWVNLMLTSIVVVQAIGSAIAVTYVPQDADSYVGSALSDTSLCPPNFVQ